MSVKTKDLTTGKIRSTLIAMTIPMIFGTLGLVIFNLVDTYFVGLLGTEEQAALTFSFPVVLVINSLAMGLGIGTSSVVSRAVGRGDHDKVRRLASDSILLSILLVIIFVTIGLLTVRPVFELLGASGGVLEYVINYMQIWYLGMVFVIVPMVGNNVIRALGDTKTPGIIMLIAATINTIFDPLLIFGVGPFPALGIEGAALATVFGRFVTFTVAMYVLVKREKIMTFKNVKLPAILASWKEIIRIGIPNALTRMVIPLASGVITSMIASYGPASVAGFGIATRIEFFALAVLSSLSAALAPFIGQNSGTKKMRRIKQAFDGSCKFSLLYSVLAYFLLLVFGDAIAQIFNSDPAVVAVTVLYMKIVALAYGFQGILQMASSALNALNKPIHASLLLVIQMVGIYIPCAYIGNNLWGMTGIFVALLISNIIAGLLGFIATRKIINS